VFVRTDHSNDNPRPELILSQLPLPMYPKDFDYTSVANIWRPIGEFAVIDSRPATSKQSKQRIT